MKTWFVYPKNAEANEALAQFDGDRAYSERECVDWRGRRDKLFVTKATEAEIERLEKDRKKHRLDFTTYLQETEGGKIRERTLGKERERRLEAARRRSIARRGKRPPIGRALLSAAARESLEKIGVRSGLSLRTGLSPR